MILNRLHRPAHPIRAHSLVTGLAVWGWFAVVYAAGTACLVAQEVRGSGTFAERLDTGIPKLMEAGEIPGLSAALVRDGKLAWSGAFGVQEIGIGEPVTSRTVFQAASLTKQFFAYTALRLADRGVIDLDTPLAEYLPYERLEHEGRYRQITAGMVLSHSTGLPNWGGERLELGFDPGTDWRYSGEGYVYLQKTLEHLTDKGLAALVGRELLEPLGLEDSWMAWRDDFAGRTSAGHDSWGRSSGVNRGDQVNAAWSLLTTAEDYARFVISLMEGRGLEAATLGRALDRGVQVSSERVETDDRLYWGLGWGLQFGPGGRAIWQWGHNNGFRAYLLAYPDRRDAFVYFTNSDNGLSIARGLLALVEEAAGFPRDEHYALDHLNYEPHDAPWRVARRGLVRAFRDEGVEAGLAHFEDLRAEHAVDEAFTTAVAADIEGVGAREAAISLLAHNAELHPRSADAHTALAVMLLNGGDYREAMKAYEYALGLNSSHEGAVRGKAWLEPVLAALDAPPVGSPAALARYSGAYGPRHVIFEQRVLYYQREGNPRYRLHPLGKDSFFLEGLGSFRVRFATDQAGNVTKIVGLYLDGSEDETPRNRWA